jgi:hypothetical protein
LVFILLLTMKPPAVSVDRIVLDRLSLPDLKIGTPALPFFAVWRLDFRRGEGHDEAVTSTEIVGSAPGIAGAGGIEVRFTPSSLDVLTELVLDGGRRRVFDALLHIGAWWPDRARTGASVVLEPRVGGLFFESGEDGCGTLLGRVSRLLMPEEFAIEGSFGLDQPVCALWTVRVDAVGPQATTLRGRYRAFGAFDDTIRAEVTAAWQARYAALVHYLAA